VPDVRAVLERCDVLARCSEEPGRLTRRFATPALADARGLVAGWMREAGLEPRCDAVGNLIGRRDGPGPTLLLGSHLDSVRDAGRYDGPLGVLAAIACVERLGGRLPFAVEVVGFADEEGLRFGTTYLGSAVFTGRFEPRMLELRDDGGVTLADAVRGFGGEPEALADAGRDPEDLLGYCEVHIEQGPVLEQRGLPVGVVEAIVGLSRLDVELRGEAGHAGTVPMTTRRDALCAAAELVLAVEALAGEHEGMVGTVGRLTVRPGSGNVVPGEAELSVDLRHHDDAVRERAVRDLRERAAAIAGERGVEVVWSPGHQAAAVQTDPRLTDALADAVAAGGLAVERMPSGAGHDAAAVSAIAPVAMLFVRCAGGVSHNPAESVTEDDVGVALDVLERFVQGVAS
jgi:allantoate deiminase